MFNTKLLTHIFLFVLIIGITLHDGEVYGQCETASVDLPDASQPVVNPGITYCVAFTIDPSVTGHPIGVCLDLQHTWQGDLSIRVLACGNTLMLMTRPGNPPGSCSSGSPFGSSNDVNGTFCFSNTGADPDQVLPMNGGNFGLSPDRCNANTVDSFDELGAGCGSDPYTFEICITDHAFGNTGMASNITPVFLNPPVCGCTDPAASNYDPSATVDDGSCLFQPCSITINHTSTPEVCGQSNGSIQINPSGGSNSYIFSWSNSSTTSQLTGLSAGSYTVTVTDANTATCTATAIITINNENLLDISSTITQPTCGEANGEAVILIEDGIGPFEYIWSSPLTGDSNEQSNLQAGTYSVTVIDQSTGCEQALSISIDDSNPIAINSTVTNTTCGLDNGAIQLVVTNDSGNLSYTWNNPNLSGSNPTGLAPGTYQVTVTDLTFNCDIISSFEVAASQGLTLNEQTIQPTCGLGNGAITIIPDGSAGPYLFTWTGTNAGNNSHASDLSPGFYTVEVTDTQSGCTAYLEISLAESSPLEIFDNTIHPLCGNENGSIEINLSNGSGDFLFEWSQGLPPTHLQNNLGEGVYSVTVTDNEGDGCTAEAEFWLENSGEISIIPQITHTFCAEANGSVSIEIEGGSGLYTLEWSDGMILTDLIRTDLQPGNFGITVTDNMNGCTATLNVVINESDPLVWEEEITHTTCGIHNGQINISIINGSGDYTANWSDPSLSGLSVEDLAPGIYEVTITDEILGCSIMNTFEILDSEPLIIQESISHTSCGLDNGGIELTIIQGSGNYLYHWNGLAPSNSPIAALLSAGFYSVLVEDIVTGCVQEIPFEIFDSEELIVTSEVIDAFCGQSNGSIQLESSIHPSELNYSWSHGMTGPLLSDIPAGYYQVTISDPNIDGCVTSMEIAVADIGQIYATSTITHTTCGDPNGNVQIHIDNGTGPYSIHWNGNPSVNDLFIQDLSHGEYFFEITDEATGCHTNLQVVIENSQPLSANINTTHTTCNEENGIVTITPLNGSGSYTYDWSGGILYGNNISGLPPGNYFVTITDNDTDCFLEEVILIEPSEDLIVGSEITHTNCGEQNGAIQIEVLQGIGPFTYDWNAVHLPNTPSVAGLTSGLYIVVVSDLHSNCTEELQITINTSEPLTGTIESTNNTCNQNNGSIQITDLNGSGDYSYHWGAFPGYNQSLKTDLLQGSYIITVTDLLTDCQVILSETVYPGDNLEAELNHTDPSCGENNGVIEVTMQNTNGDFTFLWNDNQLQGNHLTNLTPGVYTLTITDNSDGCTIEHTFQLDPSEPFTALFTTTNTTCGLKNGSISVSMTNGSGDFSYQWLHDTTLSGSIANGLSGGQTYEVTITDNNTACSLTESIFVESSSLLSAEIEINPLICGPDDASATVSVFNGSGNYSFTWQDFPDENTASLYNLLPGDYELNILDQETNCAIDTIIHINPIQTLSIVCETTQHETEFGLENGIVQFEIQNGTAPFSIQIIDDTGTEIIDTIERIIEWYNIAPGNNMIQVSDANGCVSSCSFIVNQGPCGLEASISNYSNISCAGLDDGSITVQSNQTEGVTFFWAGLTTVGNTNTAEHLLAGDYIISVTNEIGCTVILEITLQEPSPLVLGCVIQAHESARGKSDGVIETKISGGTYPYQYFLTLDQDTIDSESGMNEGQLMFSALSPGTYTFLIIDAEGCQSYCDMTIEAGDCGLEVIAQSSPPVCYLSADGSIDLTISDNIGNYQVNWPELNGGSIINNLQASMLSGGDYHITVIDSVGCVDSILVVLEEPSPIQLTCIPSHETAISAGDGAISIDLSNFTPPFTASINTNPVQNITASDPSDVEFNGLFPGLYTIQITDARGCQATCQRNINPANCDFALHVSNKKDLSCFASEDGIIELYVSDATGGVTYFWPDMNPEIGLNRRENLSAGTYLVNAIDERGCSAELSITLHQPPPIEVEISEIHPSCGDANGSISLSISGGTQDYQILWDDGQNLPMRNHLPDGMYHVTITDAHLCSIDTSTTLLMQDTLTITLVALEDNKCYGDQNGHIIIEVQSHNTQYDINWSTGDSGVHHIQHLYSGHYQVTIIDENQCETILDYEIGQPDSILLQTQLTHPSCTGSLGSVVITPTGGIGPYRLVGTAETGMQFSMEDLEAGDYSVIISDQNGCHASTELHLISSESPVCHAGSDAMLTCSRPKVHLNASIEHTTHLMYYWIDLSYQDTMAINQMNIEVDHPGSYEIMAVDTITQCITRDTAIVLDGIKEIDFVEVNYQSPLCPGDRNGFIQVVEIEGGTPPFQIYMNGQSCDTHLTNLLPGTYSIDIKDSLGCIWPSMPIVLEKPQPLVVDLPEVIYVKKGEPIVLNPTVIPNDSLLGNIRWYQDDELLCDACVDLPLQILADESSIYRIEIEDPNGCLYTAESLLKVIPGNRSYIPDAFSPNGDGKNDYFFPNGDENLSLIKEMSIYDRWGNKLFHRQDLEPDQITEGWDGTARGKDCNPGLYIYTIILVFENGTEKTFQGHVNLLR